MQKLKMAILFFVVVAAAVTAARANYSDDPWGELEKLVRAYYPPDGIRYKGTMWLTDDNGDKEKVLEQQNFEYSLLGKEYQYRIGNMEIVNTSTLLLVADHVAKTISISRQQGKSSGSANLFDLNAFKKVLEQKKATVRLTQSGEEKILTIENIDDPVIQGYQIHYSSSTYQPTKMLIGMVRPVSLDDEENVSGGAGEAEGFFYYLTIRFDSVTSLALKGGKLGVERKFVTMNKNGITLNPAYSTYELISHIEH